MRARGVWVTGCARTAVIVVVLLVAALGVTAPASEAASAVVGSAVVGSAAVGSAAVPAAPPGAPPGEGSSSSAARAAVPAVVGPRVGFTDARDAIGTVGVTTSQGNSFGLQEADPSVPPMAAPAPAPVHEGEVSSNQLGQQVFVSTRDDPRGEVYFLDTGEPTAPPTPVRITCDNTALESHPVISPDGTRVVYATDVSGVLRLRMAVLDDGEPCPTTGYDLSGSPAGADSWPTWLSDEWLAFSSTSSDPLGDIWAEYVGPEGEPPAPVPGESPVRLTTGAAAETQPASVDESFYPAGMETVLTFTTTQFRADGSIAAMNLPWLLGEGASADRLAGLTPEIYSPWVGDPPQGSEGTWVSDSSSERIRLAFTTTERDPYGDIVAASDFMFVFGDRLEMPPPAPEDEVVAHVPGRAETHPAWLPGFDEGGFRVSFTERTPSADVSDVLSADGSGRRTVAAGTGDLTGDEVGPVALDEASPSYSPDGTRIAYSRTRLDGNGVGVEIVTADADGGDVQALDADLPEISSDHEPVWSPDGTRIAFVRMYPCGECPQGSQIWVADVETRQATRVTLDEDETISWDESPSWSPDGTRVVVARTVQGFPDLRATLAPLDDPGDDSVSLEVGASAVVLLTVFNDGPAEAKDVRFTLPPSLGTGDTFTALPENASDPSCSLVVDRWACTADAISADSYQTWLLRVTGVQAGAGTLTIEPVARGSSESDTGNNAASLPVTVAAPTPAPDVAVTMSPPTAQLTAGSGDTTTITVEATNNGGPAAGVGLAVTHGDQVLTTVSTTDPSCTPDPANATVTCSLASLAAGDVRSWILTISPAEGIGTDTLTATVSISGPPADSNPSDNSATTAVTIQPPFSSEFSPPSAIGLGTGLDATLGAPAAWRGSGPGAAAAFTAVWSGPAVLSGSASAVWSGSASASTALPTAAAPTAVREALVAAPGPVTSTLWVLDVATGAAKELKAPESGSCECSRTISGRGPAWSPDGMHIAYEHHGSLRILDLVDPRGEAIALDGEVPRIRMVTGFAEEYQQEIGETQTLGAPTASRVTIGAAQDPAWSPDGAWLSLAGQPSGLADNPGIYRIRPDGTGLAVVAQARGPETEPAWQPWAGLAVTVTASAPSIRVGTGATLTATVTNPGPGPSGGTVLAIDVPAGLTVGALPSGCTQTANATGSLITCALGPLRPEPGATATDPAVPATATVAIPVTGTVEGGQAVTVAVGSDSPDDDPSDNEAGTLVTVVPADVPDGPDGPDGPDVPTGNPETDLSVTVGVTPNPGYVGGKGTVTVVVANSASGLPTDVSVTISLPTRPAGPAVLATPTPTAPTAIPSTTPPGAVELVGTPECFTGVPCDLGQLQPGTERTLTAQVRFATPGTSTITATVATGEVPDRTPTNDVASVDLVVLQPVIRLLQPIASPDAVVQAVGSDFPPGAQVTLLWDAGVNPRPVPLTVAEDGSIRATQILIFRRDRLGLRHLVATAIEQDSFDPVQDTMLVTPRTVDPPADFASRS